MRFTMHQFLGCMLTIRMARTHTVRTPIATAIITIHILTAPKMPQTIGIQLPIIEMITTIIASFVSISRREN